MKSVLISFLTMLFLGMATAFVVPSSSRSSGGASLNVPRSASPLMMAKYNTLEEILALFPEDLPVLINFYDAKTEAAIKDDIFRAKKLLEDRCKVVSMKQQDYPEMAKLWDCDTKSPAMILFKDGNPVMRLYEESNYLEIVSRVGVKCEE